jgi:hypothetical protein
MAVVQQRISNPEYHRRIHYAPDAIGIVVATESEMRRASATSCALGMAATLMLTGNGHAQARALRMRRIERG